MCMLLMLKDGLQNSKHKTNKKNKRKNTLIFITNRVCFSFYFEYSIVERAESVLVLFLLVLSAPIQCFFIQDNI